MTYWDLNRRKSVPYKEPAWRQDASVSLDSGVTLIARTLIAFGVYNKKQALYYIISKQFVATIVGARKEIS